MIRRATHDDIPAMTEMGLKFIDAAGLPAATWDDVAGFIHHLLSEETGAGFLSDRGMILGAIMPLPFKLDHLEAHELAWWSEDGQGLRLLRAFERWAQENGAAEISIGLLESTLRQTAEKLLTRGGYRPHERSYRRGF